MPIDLFQLDEQIKEKYIPEVEILNLKAEYGALWREREDNYKSTKKGLINKILNRMTEEEYNSEHPLKKQQIYDIGNGIEIHTPEISFPLNENSHMEYVTLYFTAPVPDGDLSRSDIADLRWSNALGDDYVSWSKIRDDKLEIRGFKPTYETSPNDRFSKSVDTIDKLFDDIDNLLTLRKSLYGAIGIEAGNRQALFETEIKKNEPSPLAYLFQ